MKPLSATVVLSLSTPSFRRSTASSGSQLIDTWNFHKNEGSLVPTRECHLEVLYRACVTKFNDLSLFFSVAIG